MEAEFNLTTVYVTRPLFLNAAVTAIVFFAVWFVVKVIGDLKRPDNGVWRSSGVSALASIPLLLSLPVVWIAYARIARGMSLSDGGRRALSAGLAEALGMLRFGGVVSSGLAFVGCCFLFRKIFRADNTDARSFVFWSAWAPVSTILGGLATWWYSGILFETARFAANLEQFALTGSAMAAIFPVASISLAISASRHRLAHAPWRRQFLALAVLVLACAGVAAIAEYSLEQYRLVALGRAVSG